MSNAGYGGAHPPVKIAGALPLIFMLMLIACGPTTRASAGATETTAAQARAVATSTAAEQATVAGQPLTLAVHLGQRGTLATYDVQLIATVTIANHTAAAIHLGNSVCTFDGAHTTGGRPEGRPATIGVELGDAPNHTIWQSWWWIVCMKGAAFLDVQEVPADGTLMVTLTCDLSRGFDPGVELRAGVPYTIRLKIFLWHQGTLDQFLQAYHHPEQSGVLWGAGPAVEMPFTFH